MAKIWQVLAAISVVVIAVVLFFKFAAKHGKQEAIIDHQQQQLEVQREVIETKNFQQKIISKIAVNDDAAARRQFLQLVFEERANPDK